MKMRSIANISYNVVVGDSNEDTASLLADIINTDSSSVVIATANGNVVNLVQKAKCDYHI